MSAIHTNVQCERTDKSVPTCVSSVSPEERAKFIYKFFFLGVPDLEEERAVLAAGFLSLSFVASLTFFSENPKATKARPMKTKIEEERSKALDK